MLALPSLVDEPGSTPTPDSCGAQLEVEALVRRDQRSPSHLPQFAMPIRKTDRRNRNRSPNIFHALGVRGLFEKRGRRGES